MTKTGKTARRIALGLVAAVSASQARATWLEAATPHFVIDADTTEPRLRDFATRLERFDAALRTIYGVGPDPAAASNRLRIFAVGRGDILKLCGGCGAGTAGFYQDRVGAPIIFTAALSDGNDNRNLTLDSQEVLLHEYSHHFMFRNFAGVYPLWFTEGFAELNANARFEPDGAVIVGLPANYRAAGLQLSAPLPIKSLLDPTAADLGNPERHELIYGRGWLLMHYLMLDDERRKQLDTYQKLMAEGRPSVAAAEAAFGDVIRLNRALDAYKSRRLNPPLYVKPAAVPDIVVAPISTGAAAMMPVQLRSSAGVNDRTAPGVLAQALRIAAPYPADARVQDELAEAAFDADRDDVADAAADRALAAAPGNHRALLYKGRVAVRRLATAKATDAGDWKAARAWFVKANRAYPEAALPLVLYYTSFLAQKAVPPTIAEDGLAKAQRLSPRNAGIRWLLADHALASDRPAWAKAWLKPLANAPHVAARDNQALAVIQLIDDGKAAEARKLLDASYDPNAY